LKVDSCMVERVPLGRACVECAPRADAGAGRDADRVNVPATAAGHCWPLKLETRTLIGTQGLRRSARQHKVPQRRKEEGREALEALCRVGGSLPINNFSISDWAVSRMPKRTRRASQPMTLIDRTLLNHTHAAPLFVLLNCWSQRMLWPRIIFQPRKQSRTSACSLIGHMKSGDPPKRVGCCDPVWIRQSPQHLREPLANCSES
jgi:hypothetical protein